MALRAFSFNILLINSMKYNSERLDGNWEAEKSVKPKVDTDAGKKTWCQIFQGGLVKQEWKLPLNWQ